MTTPSGCMKYNIFFFIAFIFLLLPATSHAGEFVNLVGIPGLSGDPTGEGGLNAYINALYRLSISIAALLAVIKIVIAGAKYMLSDIVTHKEDAKKDIQGALIGLLIVIGAIIILNTINTDLTELDLTVDTVTIEQDPMTVQELIAERQAALDNIASSTQSPVFTFSCGGHLATNVDAPEDFADVACARQCRDELRGVFTLNTSLIGQSTCEFPLSQARQCDPNGSYLCCAGVHRATWNNTTRTCSGVTEVRAQERQSCGRSMRVWDEAGNYCRTASCTLNTNANCCTANGNTWANNSCVLSGVIPNDDVEPLPESTITQLRSNLAGLPTELQNSIIQRAQNNIGNNLLTSSNNAEVVTEQGADSMVLSASLPANISADRRMLIENTIEVVCSDVRSNTDYSGSGVVTGSLADGTDYIACVR